MIPVNGHVLSYANPQGDFGKLEVYDFRVNDLPSPIGITECNAAFSWKIKSDIIGAKQTAYFITVISEAGDPMWDTGWVSSDISVGIRYDGMKLESCTRYIVTVKIKDQNGRETSKVVTTFEIGLPQEQPFGDAQWITIDDNRSENCTNLPAYRKAFETKKGLSITRARLYTSALGVYESYINGQRVGHNI